MDTMLQVGVKYLFQYQIPGVHRKPRWGLGKFIDASSVPIKDQELTFSGRPEYGTTTVRMSWVTSAEPVPDSSKCFMDRAMPPRGNPWT